MVAVWDFITTFFLNLSAFWVWLNEPINPSYLGDFAPIHIISVGGLMIILGFWIIKLVNPLA